MGLIFLAIGLAAGVLSGLFGIGGGLLIVPSLVAVANFSTKTALGTSLASLLLPVGFLGAYAVRPVPGRHGAAALDPCGRMIWS